MAGVSQTSHASVRAVLPFKLRFLRIFSYSFFVNVIQHIQIQKQNIIIHRQHWHVLVNTQVVAQVQNQLSWAGGPVVVTSSKGSSLQPVQASARLPA
jgi:hypothetical protein